MIVGGKGYNFPLSKYRRRPNNCRALGESANPSVVPFVLPTLPGDSGARDRLEVECHGQSWSQLLLLVIKLKAEPHAALWLRDMQAHTWVLFMGRVEAHLPEATSAHVALTESQSLFYALAILLTVALKAILESCSGIYMELVYRRAPGAMTSSGTGVYC